MEHEQIVATIESVIEQVRPAIQQDGGDIEFVRFTEGVVYVRLHGACIGCPASVFTLKMGVENAIKEQLADIVSQVVALEEYEF